MLKFGKFEVLAPGLTGEPFNESEAFGQATWLWLNSSLHREAPLYALSALLLPLISLRQFVLVFDAGKPVFYLAWASYTREAEQRYLSQPAMMRPAADLDSGDRLWILDWIAPFGHSHEVRQLVKARLFPGQCLRSLYHRGADKGLRVQEFHGTAVLPEEARFWFAQNPVLFPSYQASAAPVVS